LTGFREFTPERRDEFVRKGYKQRHFFPHRVYRLPKCGPDGYKIADRMCGESDPNRMWELVLYATGPVLDELPRDLFFDDEVVWHRQQFGRSGQVATVNVVLRDSDLYTNVHIADLVQRISRRREHKTRVENRFAGWNHMLLNAVLDFAVEHGVQRVHTPTAELAMRNTDPARSPQREMFERIYDRNVAQFSPRQEGAWWTIDVDAVGARIVRPERGREALSDGRAVCLFHDIERGLGHLDLDPGFAAQADEAGDSALGEMLAIEESEGCLATYSVVGQLLEEVRAAIERPGHCVAFHSYDHEIDGDSQQLNRCRQVDYRIKGYRPPRSLITPELSDRNLCFHNFEWLASSVPSLGTEQPTMENRVVKVPILIDDFDLYRGMPYPDWESRVVDLLRRHEFASVSLHDCYARCWLPHYPRFLERIRQLGPLRTVDELAAEVTFAHAT
jgi:hypothetical protein